MKQRLTTGWTLRRLIYLVMGAFLIAFSISEQQWFGIAFGAYFAAMGLFAFGCAGGNCYSGNCSTDIKQKKEL